MLRSIDEAFTPAEVQQALRKLASFYRQWQSSWASGDPAELLCYATLKTPDGKVENVLLPALTTMLNAAFPSDKVVRCRMQRAALARP